MKKNIFAAVSAAFCMGCFAWWITQIFLYAGTAAIIGLAVFILCTPVFIGLMRNNEKKIERIVAGLGLPAIWYGPAALMENRKPIPMVMVLTDHYIFLVNRKTQARIDLPLAQVASVRVATVQDNLSGPLITMVNSQWYPLVMQDYDKFKMALDGVMAARGQLIPPQ